MNEDFAYAICQPPHRTTEYRLMKLFYMLGACSLAPHIALKEAGLAFDLNGSDGTKKLKAVKIT